MKNFIITRTTGFCLLALLGTYSLQAASSTVPIDTLPQTKIVPSVAKITSSKTTLPNKYLEIERVMEYEFSHPDIPKAFNNCRIAFISDLHYKSLFDSKGLPWLIKLLRELKPDILLMGGDYQEGCQYVAELFDSLAAVRPPLGIYGVLGNNDYERCTDSIRTVMKQYNIHLLEQNCDTVYLHKQQIILAGIKNSTATDPTEVSIIGKCPTIPLQQKDFVILLTHTPDYAEEYAVNNTDLILAGHTHGGQVVIFGHAPKVPSRYGERFLTGLKYNFAGIPMIITNGIGTSQLPIRIGAPSEVVLITLHSMK